MSQSTQTIYLNGIFDGANRTSHPLKAIGANVTIGMNDKIHTADTYYQVSVHSSPVESHRE